MNNTTTKPNTLLNAETQQSHSVLVVGFFFSHIVLGLLLRESPLLATIHAVFVLVVGIIGGLYSPVYAAYAAAYVCGAEVLWRMTDATIFWEFGKYATIAILGVSFIAQRFKKLPTLPFLYFLFLIPALFISLDYFPADLAREIISFNLSGPLALTVAAFFFANLHLTMSQMRTLLITLTAPTLSIAIIALWGILSTNTIIWINDSNSQTSGGFGPNQVSSALGLGIFALWLLILVPFNGKKHIQLLWVILGVWLLIQAFLTFSRGGVYTTLLIIVVTLIYMLSLRRERQNLILAVLVATFIFINFIYPQLDAFTRGVLTTRFSDVTNLTNRGEIINEQLDLFEQNPILGSGVGVSSDALRSTFGTRVAAHTEFTRLLAEHGVLGVLALALLFIMFFRNYLVDKQFSTRLIVIAVFIWVVGYMFGNAMRTVAPSFLVGLTFFTLCEQTSEVN